MNSVHRFDLAGLINMDFEPTCIMAKKLKKNDVIYVVLRDEMAEAVVADLCQFVDETRVFVFYPHLECSNVFRMLPSKYLPTTKTEAMLFQKLGYYIVKN